MDNRDMIGHFVSIMIEQIKRSPNGEKYSTRTLLEHIGCPYFSDVALLSEFHRALLEAANEEEMTLEMLTPCDGEVMPYDAEFLIRNKMQVLKPLRSIRIETEPAYFGEEYDYTDKLVLTVDSVRYEYSPLFDTEKNPSYRWSFYSEDEGFKKAFNDLEKNVQAALNNKDYLEISDYGITSLRICYADGTNTMKIFRGDSEEFCFLLNAIRQMIPVREDLMPKVMKVFGV